MNRSLFPKINQKKSPKPSTFLSFQLKTNRDLSSLPEIWKHKGPFLCDVQVMEDAKIIPMLKFGAGIEDLDPKLSTEEMGKIQSDLCQI